MPPSPQGPTRAEAVERAARVLCDVVTRWDEDAYGVTFPMIREAQDALRTALSLPATARVEVKPAALPTRTEAPVHARDGDTVRVLTGSWAIGPKGFEYVVSMVDSSGFAYGFRCENGVAARDYEIVKKGPRWPVATSTEAAREETIDADTTRFVPGSAEFREAFRDAKPVAGADHCSWINGYCHGWTAAIGALRACVEVGGARTTLLESVASTLDSLGKCEQFDHHGYCQTHFITKPCEAATLAAAYDAYLSATRDSAASESTETHKE